MDAHDGGGFGRDRGGEVASMGAVGRAYLRQVRATLAQHVGDAEAAADLDGLAAGDDDLRAVSQSTQGQENGRS